MQTQLPTSNRRVNMPISLGNFMESTAGDAARKVLVEALCVIRWHCSDPIPHNFQPVKNEHALNRDKSFSLLSLH